ncbi:MULTISPECIES: tetratricopeptide repeat protein [unclassified Psychrobacter]|uniref:tetratricopeptide repeat protein n=1 Tax=unclassified Psychrobacter TaxID=196806 RepID=UPI001EDD38C6|nr:MULTISPECIES: tetratricopeptide repeat protein [unclassified Psychrobacter]MCG3871812.1 tetratricopeptide repeat protein [Psychrobacter sp. Ps7]
MLFLKRTVSARSAVITWSIKIKPANKMLAVSALAGMLSLSACQTAPTASTAIKTVPTQTLPSSQTAKAPIATVTQAPIVRTEDDYPIEPYNSYEPAESTNPLTQETPVFTPSNPVLTQPDPVIIIPSRDDYIISEPSAPSHNELLEQARKNSQQRTQQATTNNSNLPAFRNLMQAGISQLKAGKLTNAENSFTRAQRLAPKSSAVYFYLAQVALKKNQPRKAEAMARRGLSVSQDTSRRRALWQIILQSGQAQGNARVISEAKQALR